MNRNLVYWSIENKSRFWEGGGGGVIGVLNINLVNWGIEYSFRPLRNLKIYLVYWGIDHKSRLFGVIKCKSSFERYWIEILLLGVLNINLVFGNIEKKNLAYWSIENTPCPWWYWISFLVICVSNINPFIVRSSDINRLLWWFLVDLHGICCYFDVGYHPAHRAFINVNLD